MAMIRRRASYRRPGRVSGLTALTLAATATLFCSTVFASPSWAAGSVGDSARPAMASEANKPATVILADAKRATEGARTAHVVGTIRQSGTNLSFNIVVGHGQGGGKLTDDGAAFNIIVHQPKVYLKAGQATWTKLANAAAASLLANRWLETTTANKDFTDLAKFADITELTQQLSPSGKLLKKKTTTFAGQSAIPLVDTGPGGGTLYIAADGSHYILGLIGPKSGEGSVRWSQYNSAKVPPAPKGALNLDQLENGANAGAGTTTSTSTGI